MIAYMHDHTLAKSTRDRQFQMFWANIQVLGPSIYARPPIPVVVPRFKDRKPLPRAASEILERCAIKAGRQEDHILMYGPTDGELKFILGLAIAGLVSLVAVLATAATWAVLRIVA
jgi:hypothetical protein